MSSLNPSLRLALISKTKAQQNLLQKGFSLVELLVVVVIIGILSGVALPNFLAQRGRASVAAWNAQAAAIVTACEVAAATDAASIVLDTDVARLITASDTEVDTSGVDTSACVVTIPDTPTEVTSAGTFTMFGVKTPAT